MTLCTLCGATCNATVCQACMDRDMAQRRAEVRELTQSRNSNVCPKCKGLLVTIHEDEACVCPLKTQPEQNPADSPPEETILSHLIVLNPEEVNGVRKFFKAMKFGVYLHCPGCRKFKRMTSDPIVLDGTDVYCSHDCIETKQRRDANAATLLQAYSGGMVTAEAAVQNLGMAGKKTSEVVHNLVQEAMKVYNEEDVYGG